MHYDIELLVTGEKDVSLEEKYRHAKKKFSTEKNIKISEKKTKNKQVYSKKTSQKTQAKTRTISVYWLLVAVSAVVSFLIILSMLIL